LTDAVWELTKIAIRTAIERTSALSTAERHRIILHSLPVNVRQVPVSADAFGTRNRIAQKPAIRPSNQWYGATDALLRRTAHLQRRCGHPTRSHSQVYSGASGASAAYAWIEADSQLSLDEDEQRHWERILSEDKKL